MFINLVEVGVCFYFVTPQPASHHHAKFEIIRRVELDLNLSYHCAKFDAYRSFKVEVYRFYSVTRHHVTA